MPLRLADVPLAMLCGFDSVPRSREQEFSRLDVLLRVQSGRLRVSDACALIGLERRQVFRLLRGLKQDGAATLLSKRSGQPSNHRLPAEVRTLALSIVRERYCDFGPSLASGEAGSASRLGGVARELARLDDRRWLWGDRRHHLASPHQPRRGRDWLGELVQIDGSEHAWFEDREAPCTLLTFVDDATSRLPTDSPAIAESQKDRAMVPVRMSALRLRAAISPSTPSVRRIAPNSERRVATSLIAPSR